MKSRLLAAVAIGAVFLVAPASAQVKIGILNDQSRVYADSGGKYSLEAARMAVEDFGGEEGAQIKVEDPRLPPDYRLGNSLDRIMSCPLGTISKRSRLEIRLEDRLEYELERALHHSVADRRNREDTDFAPVLR